MVEFLLIKHHDARTAPLVIGMAIPAGFFRKTSMKTLAAFDISSNGFMAIKAKTILRGAIKTDMTVFATNLKVGMPGDQVARHQCRLQVLCLHATAP